MSQSKPPLVGCPICGKSVAWTRENPYKPFCCERCKLIDLGQWASEGYRVPLSDSGEDKPKDES
jgi:hypothetical protein